MEFEYSKKTKMYMEQITDFMDKYIYPNEQVYHDQFNSGPRRPVGRCPLRLWGR